MFGGKRQTGLRSFLLGGLLGGLAGVAATRSLRRSKDGEEAPDRVDDIAAFEEAPCHREWHARTTEGTPSD